MDDTTPPQVLIARADAIPAGYVAIGSEPTDTRSDRSAVPALLLALVLGLLGAHRLYLGKYVTAIIVLLLTLSGSGLILTIPWVIIDMLVIVVGLGTDGTGRRLRFWG